MPNSLSRYAFACDDVNMCVFLELEAAKQSQSVADATEGKTAVNPSTVEDISKALVDLGWTTFEAKRHWQDPCSHGYRASKN